LPYFADARQKDQAIARRHIEDSGNTFLNKINQRPPLQMRQVPDFNRETATEALNHWAVAEILGNRLNG
jgi:hypothetical protein